MRFRAKPEITDKDEQQAVEDLHSFVRSKERVGSTVPSESYWSNLIVRTNRRLDELTSGKALSVSWAARVAIPGVVAIISFYIGLHYYVPEQRAQETAIAPILASLSQSEVDSLITEQSLVTGVNNGHNGIFTMTGEDAAEYLIAAGEPTLVLETLSDEELNRLLTTLGARKNL